jgi:glutathione S-transferase
MHLYHQVRSSSTRVLWMLEEIGAPYELTVIAREDKQSDWYRAMHPLGKAPVAVDDEGPVFESIALCLHLADLHPEAGLIETPGSHGRALQYQWAFFAVAELSEAMMTAARELWSDGEPDQEVVDRAMARLGAASDVVERAIAADGWLVGGKFTVADLAVGAMLIFARMNDLGTPTPGIAAYLDRLESRPARQRAVAITA